MCTPNQVADDYERLLRVWDSNVVPQLSRLVSSAPQVWQDRTFVYVFDRFCHFIVVEVDRLGLAGQFAHLGVGEVTGRQRQFSDFVTYQLPQVAPQPESFRESQFEFASAFHRRHKRALAEGQIRRFFQELHAVGHGSYAFQRIEAVNRAPLSELLEVLELLADERLPIYERIKRSLTPRPRGVKIYGLGPACIAEVPGWLFVEQPRKYPIVNGKFVKTLDHLGLYDANSSCF